MAGEGGVEAGAGSVGLAAENARLRAQLVEAHAVIAELRAANEALQERVAAQAAVIERLGEQVTDLSARVGMDSSNSSKPPSSDGYGRSARQRRDRGSTGRRAGRAAWRAGVAPGDGGCS